MRYINLTGNAVTAPELWGGVECTVNRVGHRTFNQLERSGHTRRLDDLSRFAELGFTRLRHAILWETVVARIGAADRWHDADAAMRRLGELGVRPIVGLLHHGSGPRGTDLLDRTFPEKFAAFAGRVAARFPTVDAFTPINEPLATARFSGLYGHWYPHQRSDRAFVRIVLNQCRAIILANQAIRRCTPQASYVHTDDVGTVFSTPALAYQADFENHRQFLALDLVSGLVDASHPLWSYVRDNGASRAELEWLQRHATPPHLIGADYYVTSDRYLDEHHDVHPIASHGGNHTTRYADVAAAGAMPGWSCGFERALRTLWSRYARPVALTEVHIGCTRDEQLRWLAEAWQAACRVSDDGIPVRAVTAWALMGSSDWNSLATQHTSYYEPGAFDARGAEPRITAIGRACASICASGSFEHRVLDQPGLVGIK